MQEKNKIRYYPGPDWERPGLYYWKLWDLIWFIPAFAAGVFGCFHGHDVTWLALTLLVLFLRIGNGRLTVGSMIRNYLSFFIGHLKDGRGGKQRKGQKNADAKAKNHERAPMTNGKAQL